MDKKMLTTVAVVCGAVAILGVFLPWVSMSMGKQSMSFSGTQGDLKGVWVLILGAIGVAAAVIVMMGKVDAVPLDEAPLLFIAAGVFGLAAILTLTDFLRDFGPASKGIGIIVCLLGCIGAAATSALAGTKAKSV